MKFTVYEVDYNDRCYEVGTADNLKEAKKLARDSLKKSHYAYTIKAAYSVFAGI